MAAAMARRAVLTLPRFSSVVSSTNHLGIHRATKRAIPTRGLFSGKSGAIGWTPSSGNVLTGVVSAVVTGTAAFVWVQQKVAVSADSGEVKSDRPVLPPSRSIKSNTDDTGLKLTFYQYQTCPFCCKLRAYLDYRGFSYDVIEVNSVRRTQIKWSKYKKVPILVIEGLGPEGYLQLNDSSVITSILESYLVNRKETIENLKSFYPCLESKTERGKVQYEYPNRYFIMFGENKPTGTPDSRKEERKWRHWTDAILVHTLSPNVYRTPSEALQTFRYFDEVGEWKKHFSSVERSLVIYVGAAAMYLIGKSLIKKYNLKQDVRESLYDACYEWTKAVGKNRPFMGGDEPNLSDVAVYGVLSSIEGCLAFQDLRANTNIGTWFDQMKENVSKSKGSSAMSSFTHE